MRITLHDGTKVRVDGVIMSRPYGGMMEGIPTRSMNEEIMEEAKTSFHKQWGTRKVHVVDPPRTIPKIAGHDSPETWPEMARRAHPNPERLPECMYHVWLHSCDTPEGTDWDGSELVLVFFVDMDSSIKEPLETLIRGATVSFQWKDVAQGFLY